MKKITVSDILNLDIFSGYRLVAGKSGLLNEIHYINIYDNPISEIDTDIQLFPGDVYLTFFYYGKDDTSYIMHTLDYLISQKGAALIVFDEYMNTLPKDAIALCDAAGLPVIFLNCRTPYSLVIASIMECKIAMEQKNTLEEKLETIVSRNSSADEKHHLLKELNPSFQQNITALFAQTEADVLPSDIVNLISIIIRDLRNFAAEFRGGILFLLSYPDSRNDTAAKTIQHTADQIHTAFPGARIGVSNPHKLDDAGRAISESLLCITAGKPDAAGRIDYSELGVARILVDFLGSPALEEFYNDITLPIQKSDAQNNTCLFDTMRIFAEYEMDYKKTAEAMFVHENTIRYRISKLKELIPYGKSDMDFLETISIISKIHYMKQR
ncbi:PucR family transcriptional regulator [Senimuribacter intestinalis]|uniref:PucR family transcriptional regulator n=1 Tax=Senimuribacter intestinalis TaxID=2941507 RepID=UPI002040B678|nr:PucR family transcriptional regulator [Senimuribacter intestinalis]